MKTIISVLEDYEEADAAVRDLPAGDLDIDKINVILLETVAKNSIDVNLDQIKVNKSKELGHAGAHGLDGSLGGEQALRVPENGL